MATMAENVIVAGAENRPPMLKKGMYDSWKSSILLYIKGKENGEMLIDSINKEGTAKHKRLQELEDLTPEEKLRKNCDDLQLHTTSIFKADHVDAFDLDCDEAPTASAIIMEEKENKEQDAYGLGEKASISSNYGSKEL
ncbi:hypothetical protein Tco_1085118 [Tanacetum coccineum]